MGHGLFRFGPEFNGAGQGGFPVAAAAVFMQL
jgi:hypothetical protein